MDDLRALFSENPSTALMASGLLIGFVFGAILFRTNFCTMGAVSDWVNFRDARRLRSWLLAIAVAMVGTQALGHLEVVDPNDSILVSESFIWFGNLTGGALFGFGMVFAGGCASRNLTRLGGGDIRALFALIIMGIVAYSSMSGVLSGLRRVLQQLGAVDMAVLGVSTTNVGRAVGRLSGGASEITALALSCILALVMITICFTDPRFRKSAKNIIAGVAVGLCIVAGWAVTGLAYDEFADQIVSPTSLSFVRPTGAAVEWLERSTALGLPGFGAATVFGSILGACAMATVMGRFRLQSFTGVNDTLRTMFGATLMGFGGVTALGCTIGQGITGTSTLALGSFVTLAAIIAGSIAGLRALEYQLEREAASG